MHTPRILEVFREQGFNTLAINNCNIHGVFGKNLPEYIA
jgi:desulfoferrodoxin (superoxide reductase-like protein)